MHGYNPTILSAVDYARLQGMMCTLIGSQTPLAALLRCKLESVAIVRRSDAGPDVVTVERTIRFRINDRRPGGAKARQASRRHSSHRSAPAFPAGSTGSCPAWADSRQVNCVRDP